MSSRDDEVPAADGSAPGPAARDGRPAHLDPRYLAVVLGAGTVGTLCRYLLEGWLPAPSGWPLPTLIINLAGSFLLGLLLEALARRGPDEGRRRWLRLLFGTGFLGAFTTYSTFALEANELLLDGRAGAAVLYLLASLLAGCLMAVLGIWAAAGLHAHRRAGERGGG